MKTIAHPGAGVLLSWGCAIWQILVPSPLVAQSGEISSTPSELAGKKEAKPITAPVSVELMAAITQEREKIYRTMISDERRLLVQVMQLGDAQAKALEAPAKSAAAASLKEWAAKAEESLRKSYFALGEGGAGFLTHVTGSTQAAAIQGFMLDVLPPAERSEWTEAVKASLSEDQLAAWTEFRRKRAAKLHQELEANLPGMIASTADQLRQPLVVRIATASRDLARAQRETALLNALANSVVERRTDAMRMRAEKMVSLGEGLPGSAHLLQPEYFGWAGAAVHLVDEVAEFNTGLTEVLPAEALRKLQDAASQREERRQRAVALGFLAAVDAEVALTPDQREKLEPIAMRLVQASPRRLRTVHELKGRYVINSTYTLGSQLSAKEVLEILDAQQWKRWQEVCNPRSVEPRPAPPTLPVLSKAVDTPLLEKENFEERLGEYLYQMAEICRGDWLDALMLKTEDLARSAALPEAAKERLQMEARRAVDAQMVSWRSELEKAVRGGANDAAVRDLVSRTSLSILGLGTETEGNEQGVWTKAVALELTAAQQATWRQAVESRRRFRQKAIAQTALKVIDQKLKLSSDQWSQLEPKVERFVDDYATDLANDRPSEAPSLRSATEWYGRPILIYLPLVGIPLEELKSILDAEQWHEWDQSSERAEVDRMWPAFKQSHDRRVRAAGQP